MEENNVHHFKRYYTYIARHLDGKGEIKLVIINRVKCPGLIQKNQHSRSQRSQSYKRREKVVYTYDVYLYIIDFIANKFQILLSRYAYVSKFISPTQ